MPGRFCSSNGGGGNVITTQWFPWISFCLCQLAVIEIQFSRIKIIFHFSREQLEQFDINLWHLVGHYCLLFSGDNWRNVYNNKTYLQRLRQFFIVCWGPDGVDWWSVLELWSLAAVIWGIITGSVWRLGERRSRILLGWNMSFSLPANHQAEWSSLIGPDPSRYWALIGGTKHGATTPQLNASQQHVNFGTTAVLRWSTLAAAS